MPDIAALHSLRSSYAAQEAFSGGVGFPHGAAVIYEHAFWRANRPWNVPYTPQACYRLASYRSYSPPRRYSRLGDTRVGSETYDQRLKGIDRPGKYYLLNER